MAQNGAASCGYAIEAHMAIDLAVLAACIVIGAYRGPCVLVVAPHTDDYAIGCGGTLLRLARRDARIRVTYITDGSAPCGDRCSVAASLD